MNLTNSKLELNLDKLKTEQRYLESHFSSKNNRFEDIIQRINESGVTEKKIETYNELREAMENPLLFQAKPFNFKSIEFAFEFFGIFVSLLDKVLKIYKYLKLQDRCHNRDMQEVIYEARSVFKTLKSGFVHEARKL